MTSPLHRLRVGLLTLAAIFVVAMAGYRIAGWDWLESFYMVVVTLSTVGYKEVRPMSPGLQLFTSLVIIFGVSTALYIIGGIIQMMAEGELNRALGLRRVTNEIKRLTGHVIICGFGRMGEILADELSRKKMPFVIIDKDAERITQAMDRSYLAITDDATEEEALVQAGVQRATTLVTTLPGDTDNVFITLTARNLNASLQIIARGELQSTERKLIQAGANRVVLPAATGAMRMAAMVTRPSSVELIELVSGRAVMEVEIDELRIHPEHPLVGSTVRESGTRSRHGLLIVGVRRADGNLVFNPDADTIFQANDMILVMGRVADIERFRQQHKV
jgi:voltage-gated potassium channel